MRILIITDTIKNKEQAAIAEGFRHALTEHEIIIFDMNCCMMEHEKYYTIRDMKPDLIITMDAAGFEMRNIMGVLSYNSLKCRMAHLFFDRAYKYSDELSCLQNLSMFTYVQEKEDLAELKESFGEVPSFLHHHLTGGTSAGGAYREWFEEFLRDAHFDL